MTRWYCQNLHRPNCRHSWQCRCHHRSIRRPFGCRQLYPRTSPLIHPIHPSIRYHSRTRSSYRCRFPCWCRRCPCRSGRCRCYPLRHHYPSCHPPMTRWYCQNLHCPNCRHSWQCRYHHRSIRRPFGCRQMYPRTSPLIHPSIRYHSRPRLSYRCRFPCWCRRCPYHSDRCRCYPLRHHYPSCHPPMARWYCQNHCWLKHRRSSRRWYHHWSFHPAWCRCYLGCFHPGRNAYRPSHRLSHRCNQGCYCPRRRQSDHCRRRAKMYRRRLRQQGCCHWHRRANCRCHLTR